MSGGAGYARVMEPHFEAGDRVRDRDSGAEGMVLETVPADPATGGASAIVDMVETAGPPAAHVPVGRLELAEPHGPPPEKCIDLHGHRDRLPADSTFDRLEANARE